MKKYFSLLIAFLMIAFCFCSAYAVDTDAEMSEYSDTVLGYGVSGFPESFQSQNIYFATEGVFENIVIVSIIDVFPEDGCTVDEAMVDEEALRAYAYLGTVAFSKTENDITAEKLADYLVDPDSFHELMRNDGHNLFFYAPSEEELYSGMDFASEEEVDAVDEAFADIEELLKNVVLIDKLFPKLSFTTVDLYGNPITSEECFSESEVTLFNCWASFCNPCEKEMPSLVEADEILRTNGCQVLLCLYDTDDLESEEYLDALGLLDRAGASDLKCIMVNNEIYDQLDGYVLAYPTSYAVGSDGQVLGSEYNGDRSVESFVDWVNSFRAAD